MTHSPRSRGALNFLVRNALALVSTSALTSGLGFLYWAAGARLFQPSVVGEAATAIAAMSLLASFATLGFGTLLMSELPRMTSRRSDLVMVASLLSGLAGAVLAIVATVVLPGSFLGLPGAGSQIGATLLFTAGVSAAAVGIVLDQGLLSLVGGGPQLGRNTILSVGKLVLLGAFALLWSHVGASSIYASWLLGNAISIAATGLWVSARHGVRLRHLRPSPRLLHGLSRDAAEHHALNLALSVPYFAMPIVAHATLGSAGAAVLYATWSVAGFVFVLPIALSMALFASGARDSSDFTYQFRFSFRAALLACLAANAIIFPLGGLVLTVFGSDYADAGHTALVLLCLSGFPLIVKDHHVSVARVTGHVGREAAVIVGLTVVELAAATTGALTAGLNGLAAGFLIAVWVEGLLLAPPVVRALRGRLSAVRAPADAAPASA